MRLCPTAPAGAQRPARMEPIHQTGPQMLTKTVLEAKAGAESRKGRKQSEPIITSPNKVRENVRSAAVPAIVPVSLIVLPITETQSLYNCR